MKLIRLVGERQIVNIYLDNVGINLDLNVTDEVLVAEAYRRKNHVNNLIADGWVRQSFFHYSSPMVCVRKKDGGLLLCLDYRKLNKKTILDKQPIPRIQDILDSLKGKKWFTTLDMSQAYHQRDMSENSRKYTAFSTLWSLYEWIQISYGIMNALAGFQRFINNCLFGLRDKVCTMYLDDIFVYSENFENQVLDVWNVLRCLRGKGVKLNPDKCQFFRKEIQYFAG